MQRSGCLVLVKSIIAARPVHHLLVMEAPDWVFDDINGCMRLFFWAGKDHVNGGHCLVARNMICKPLCFSGLGVKNLQV